MATRPSQEETKVDTRDDSKVAHDFVYRPDMGIKEIAEYLDTDWDNAKDWLKNRLEEADEDYE